MVRQYPLKTENYCLLAKEYQDCGQTDLAKKTYQAALLVDQNCAEACFNLGLIHKAGGDKKQKQEFLVRALTIWLKENYAQPDYDKCLKIARIYLLQYEDLKTPLGPKAVDHPGYLDLAIKVAEQAIELDDKRAEAYYSRGTFQAEKGQFQVAVDSFRQAVDRDPSAPLSWRDLALALYKDPTADKKQLLANLKEACQAWEKAQNLGYLLTEEEVLNLSRAYFQVGDYAKALRNLQVTLAAQPNWLEGLFLAAQADYNLGFYSEAADFLGRARLLDNDHLPAIYLSILVGLKLNPDLKERSEDLDRLTAADLPWLGQAYSEIGFILYDSGCYENAIVFLEKALSAFLEAAKLTVKDSPQDPQIVKIYHGLALAYWKLGRNNEANQVWEKLIALNSKDPVAHFNLGVFYLNQEQYKNAIDHFRAASVWVTQNDQALLVECWLNQGRAYEALGDDQADTEKMSEKYALALKYFRLAEKLAQELSAKAAQTGSPEPAGCQKALQEVKPEVEQLRIKQLLIENNWPKAEWYYQKKARKKLADRGVSFDRLSEKVQAELPKFLFQLEAKIIRGRPDCREALLDLLDLLKNELADKVFYSQKPDQNCLVGQLVKNFSSEQNRADLKSLLKRAISSGSSPEVKVLAKVLSEYFDHLGEGEVFPALLPLGVMTGLLGQAIRALKEKPQERGWPDWLLHELTWFVEDHFRTDLLAEFLRPIPGLLTRAEREEKLWINTVSGALASEKDLLDLLAQLLKSGKTLF